MPLDAVAALVQCASRRAALAEQLRHLESDSTPVHIYQLGISTVAPSAAIAKAMQHAASSAIALDGVAVEAAAITDSLSTLSLQAESAVKRVRELDTTRARIQLSLERVEDIIELRQCLSGVTAAMSARDMEGAALQVKRFRAIERLLPVPDADVAIMREAETQLMEAVTKELDAAILLASAGQQRQQQGQPGAAAASVPSPPTASISATITRCCQLMNLLGHADTGLSRFTSYLKGQLAEDCRAELRALALQTSAPPPSSGTNAALTLGPMEIPAAAVNALSAVLSRAATALDSAGSLAEALFNAEGGPTTVLIAVHSTADKHASRLVASFARCGRAQALALARPLLLKRAAGESVPPASSSSGGGGGPVGPTLDVVLAAVDDESVDAPFSAPPSSVTSPLYCGLDYSDPGVFDAFVDEIAIMLQRCASYARLVDGRAHATDALTALAAATMGPSSSAASSSRYSSSSSSGSAAAPALSLSSTSSAVATAGPSRRGGGGGDSAPGAPSSLSHQSPVPFSSATSAVAVSGAKLREASGELGAFYSLMESTEISAGLCKAISIDSVAEDGAQGASVDIMGVGTSADNFNLDHNLGPGSAASTDAEVSEDAGAGACISTVIEDSFYVCQKALRRAFATGNSDCASSVVNLAVASLGDTLLAELEARLKYAFEDSVGGAVGGGGGGSSGGSSSSGVGTIGSAAAAAGAQSDRLSLLKAALMSSAPMRGAASKLLEYQALGSSFGSPGRGGRGGSPARMRDQLAQSQSSSSSSPAQGGLIGGGSGSGGGGGSSSGDATGLGDSRGLVSTSAPVARLTEEVASAALTLNNLQLAAACCNRLQHMLMTEAADVFSDPRELDKVRNCVSALSDVSATLRRVQDGGIATLCARLTPRLRSAINVFEGVSSLIRYDVSEDAFAAASDGGNAFVSEFLPVLASILAPLQYALTPSLSASVVIKVGTYVAKQLEPRIRRKQFNQLGGIQFDSDVRSLVSFFVTRSSRRVREKFARLLQIARLLNLESPSEILEYWEGSAGGSSSGGGGIASGSSSRGGGDGSSVPGVGGGTVWELSAEEVRAVLGLRVDFKPAEIAQLKL